MAIGKRTEKAIKKLMAAISTDGRSPRLERSVLLSDNINCVTALAGGGNVRFRFYDSRENSVVCTFSLNSIIGKRYARRKTAKPIKRK